PTEQPAPVDDKMVVSEIGEESSPQTAPASTAPKAGTNKVPSGAAAVMISPAKGSKIPKEPHEVPVAKAMPPATRKRIGTNHTAETDKLVTRLAKYSPVPSWPMSEPSIHAKRKI